CDSAPPTSTPSPPPPRGGALARAGVCSLACPPAESIGKRISDLRLDNGRPLEAHKSYKVGGWASVNPQQGKPVWDVFASYLRSGRMPPAHVNNVTLKGVDGNPGISG